MSSSRYETRDLMVAMFVCAAAGVALFAHMFGLDLPLATAAFWSMPKNDMVVMTAGYQALLNEPWSLLHPLITDDLASAPLSIVFTDSIPWIALALKASGLGALFNPLGVFLLLSYVLQGASMVILLRALGVRRLAPLMLGGLLALMAPAWIIRQFGHIALSGHFILILGLALAVTVARRGLTRWRVAGFCALAAFATGVHAYHLVPIAACLAAALLSDLLVRGWKALPQVLASGLAVSASVALSAIFLGYTTGRGASGGEGAIGLYSMNVLGPFEPQGSTIFGQAWTGSWFSGAYDPTGGQAFEGYNYSGVGVLATVALALALLAVGLVRGARPTREQLLRFAPLGLAALALTLAAIGPTVYVHMTLVAQLPKPSGQLAEWVGLFRSHGRFYWTAGYLLTAAAIVVASSRLPPRVFAAVAVALVALQAYDTMSPRQGVRETFSTPDSTVWPEQMATAPSLRGRQWVFNPTYFCLMDGQDRTALSQLSLIAMRSGGSVNSSGTARRTIHDCGYPASQLHDAAPGDRRITVVLNGSQEEGGRLQPFARRNDCRRFERGVICGRDLESTGLPAVRGADLLNRTRMFQEIRFDTGVKEPFLQSGWSQYDPGGKGIWSDGLRAVVALPTPRDLGKDDTLVVDMILFGYSDQPFRPQPLTVSMGDRMLRRIEVKPNLFDSYRVRIPADLLRPGQPVELTFDLPQARAPATDPRRLGVAIQSVKLSY